MNDNMQPTVDFCRAFHIDGWTAAVVVYPNGGEMFWLLAPTDDKTAGCACAGCAPHDQVAAQLEPA